MRVRRRMLTVLKFGLAVGVLTSVWLFVPEQQGGGGYTEAALDVVGKYVDLSLLGLAKSNQKHVRNLPTDELKRERSKEDARLAERKKKEDARLVKEQRQKEEEDRQDKHRKREEESRLAEERRKEEEAKVKEQKRKEEEARIAEQKRKEEEARIAEQKRKEEARIAEQKRKEEEARIAEEKRKEEEAQIAEQKRKNEEARVAEQKKQEEEARVAEEKRKEEARVAEVKRKEEDARVAEEKRKEEDARVAEEKSKEEEARVAEEKRKEDARVAEEKRKEEEARVAEANRKEEEVRVAEEKRKEEEVRVAEEKRKAEEAKSKEQKRKEAEAKVTRAAKEQKKEEEARIAEQKKREEEAKVAKQKKAEEDQRAEQKRKQEQKKKTEQKRLDDKKSEEQKKREAAVQQAKLNAEKALQKQKEEQAKVQEEHRQEQLRRIANVKNVNEEKKADDARRQEEYEKAQVEVEHFSEKQAAGSSSEGATTDVHLAVVACGDRMPETVILLKSARMLSRVHLHFHVFAEEELKPKFREALEAWPEDIKKQTTFDIKSLAFPPENAAEWKKLFKTCASQRLFLPDLLPKLDAVLYLDTDILFMRPPEDIWHFFHRFNSSQIAALAPEHEDAHVGWYNRFARHPFYPPLGVNSGVMLMNLTRMRQVKWVSAMIPYHKEYKYLITWGDQDLINIFFHFKPEMLYVYPCHWNFRPDHCMYMSICKQANENGANLVHGNRRVWFEDKQPAFKALYQAFEVHKFEDGLSELLTRLNTNMTTSGVKNTNCGKVSESMIGQLKRQIRLITKPKKETSNKNKAGGKR